VGIFRYRRRTFVREVLLVAVAIVYCVPVYVMITLALKSNGDVITKPLAIPTHPRWGNFSGAWKGVGGQGLGSALMNSLVMTVSTVALLIVLGSLAAYTIARHQSKLSTGLYLLFVAAIIVPYQLGVIPIYIVMRHAHLLGTMQGMILYYTGLLMPLTIFLYAGFIRVLPREYEEAAQVDGAGLIRTWLRVVFPLLRPITGTVAVLTGLITWNEFFLPLVFLSGTHNQPITVTIYSFVGEYVSQWNYIFAAVMISIAPLFVFYLFTQKHLIKGFSGGIRG
jgi:raffinose/stachyose/melibiose transport system permease protein